jgi:WD40 repeat protein
MTKKKKKKKKPSTPSDLPPWIGLVATLRVHVGVLRRIVWSPDGRMLAVASRDRTLEVWDPLGGKLLRSLSGHESYVWDVDWSPDGKRLVSASNDQTLRIWSLEADQPLATLKTEGFAWSAAWSPDGRFVASGLQLGPCNVRVWDVEGCNLRWDLKGHTDLVSDLGWSSDGKVLASVSDDDTGRLCDGRTGTLLHILRGHSDHVRCLAWAPDNRTLATGGNDRTIRLWDALTGELRAVMEHAEVVYGLSYSPDGRVLASQSRDAIQFWDGEGGAPLATLSINLKGADTKCLAFHPAEPLLAAIYGDENAIHILRLDLDLLLRARPAAPAVRYTTAKIPLVGDQLVGKTTLGHRLITGEHKLFPRTHGQQFWTFPALSTRRADGTECEAILWDLAGQPDYRLTHSLFLDDAHLALVLFNASDRQQPLKGAEYWLKVLRSRPGSPCRSILVAAQKDTGEVSLAPEEIDSFCRVHGVTGGYVATSAATGEGVEALVARLREHIDWDRLPPTVTTAAFKRIKDFVLELKTRKSEGQPVMVTPEALRASLSAADQDLSFTESDVLTAAGHLANHGFVTILRTSGGGARILLMPDLLINLTASLVLEARRNPRGLGALKEAEVLANRFSFPELAGLGAEDRGTLLDAAVALFLEHNVCFRETLGAETLLVFPALIHQRKPQLAAEVPAFEDVSYAVEGAVEHLYSALVVLLGYTNTFTRTNQWHDQAEYETGPGQICGFRQASEREGETTFVLYYGAGAEDRTRRLFEGLFETFLLARDLRVTKFPAVSCPACGYRQERDEIVKRIAAKKGFTRCAECGKKITLPEAGEKLGAGRAERETVERDHQAARLRTAYETALSHLKGLVRDRNRGRQPSCFLSYAWGVAEHERWVAELAQNLQKAEVRVVFDKKDNAAIGASVARFISDGLEESDFVAAIGTAGYLQKYENKASSSGGVAAAEVDLIHLRLTGTEEMKMSVLPVLLEGDPEKSFPPLLRGRVYSDFRSPGDYLVTLFDLVLTLHGIAVGDPAVADLRAGLRQRSGHPAALA